MPGRIPSGDLKVKHYITANPSTVNPNINFLVGIAVMIIKSIGNLIVKQNQRPISILTEREILVFIILSLDFSNK
jgi:predicted transcriptional regulator